MSAIERFNPDTMAPPFSRYSQGVAIPAQARTLIVAGQVGVEVDGTVPEDMAAQTAQAFRNIQSVLRAGGMDLEDLVETRTYMTSRDDLPGYREGRRKVLGDEGPVPAAALVFVAGLAQPHWKIEICAMAAKV